MVVSLGNNIYNLRQERGMSQLELAEALNVSRQSISKWETDASVPELDKIMKLAELFEVTLDELVRGEKPQEGSKEPEPKQVVQEAPKVAENGFTGRKIVALVLFCMAFVVFVLCVAVGGGVYGVIYALPFVVCGLICLFKKQHPGLFCAWAVFLLADAFLRYASGMHWSGMFHLVTDSIFSMYGLVGFAQLAYILALIVSTVVVYRKKPLGPATAMSLLILVVVALLITYLLPLGMQVPIPYWYYTMIVVSADLRLIVFTFALSVLVRWLYARKQAQK